jgi:hypothetical protein
VGLARLRVVQAVIAYDPDVFDAELAVERSGHAHFDKDQLAELLGLSSGSMNQLRLRGHVPLPDHYLGPDGRRCDAPGGHRRAIWTIEQATSLLVTRTMT